MFFKMHVEAPGISYEDAVEEALCFGWVDSIVRSIDADRYEQRFTPRRSGSRWSKPNVQRMKKLVASGRVMTAGHTAFAARKASRDASPGKAAGRARTSLSKNRPGVAELPPVPGKLPARDHWLGR